MNIIKNILVSLPARMQDSVMESLMRNGKIFKTPVWAMLFRTMNFMGVNTEEVRNAFRQMKEMNLNSTTVCRLKGHEFREIAKLASKNGMKKEAREAYFQAASFYLLSDFFQYKPEEEKTNYYLALPCYDEFRKLSELAIEKVEIPYKNGAIMAYLHLPEGDGPFPAIIFTQGNEGVKEGMTEWTYYATTRGIAVFNSEPPGWGESGLSGTNFRGMEDIKGYVMRSIEFLEGRPEICNSRIGIFGVSYGAFLSLYCAGLEPRITAAGGIGAPFLDINKVRKNALAAQRRKSLKISGAKSEQEHSLIMSQLEMERIISQVECPALVIHGKNDYVLDGIKTNQKFAAVLSGEVTSKVVENGDHLCSQFLKDWLADYVFDWYAECLV